MTLKDARRLARLHIEKAKLEEEWAKHPPRDPEWRVYSDALTLVSDEIAEQERRFR